jgi:hypothetical protein
MVAAQLRGKIAPHGSRSESFVQEDHQRSTGIAAVRAAPDVFDVDLAPTSQPGDIPNLYNAANRPKPGCGDREGLAFSVASKPDGVYATAR